MATMTRRDLRLRFLAFVCVTTLPSGCHEHRWVDPPFEPAAEARWHEARRYLIQRNAEEGCEALRQTILLQPEQPYAYRDIRSYCTKGKQYDLALSIFQDAAKANAENEAAWSFLGDTLIDMHRWTDAIEAYKKLIRFAPGNCEIHYTLGALYLEVGDREAALGEYEELIHLKMWSWPYSFERHMYDRRAKQLLDCIETGKIVLTRSGSCGPDW
jgi:tetratricopeptide (TPR) repeat protein